MKPCESVAIAASMSAAVATATLPRLTPASAASSGARSARQARSTPLELARDAPYKSRGKGSATASMRASGEASSTSAPRASSANWCTNDELAPFSSSRRTK